MSKKGRREKCSASDDDPMVSGAAAEDRGRASGIFPPPHPTASHAAASKNDGGHSRSGGFSPPGASHAVASPDDGDHSRGSLLHYDRRRLKPLDYRHFMMTLRRRDGQPFVLDDFHHDELAKGDSIWQLNLPPDAPLPSRNQDRSLIFGKSQPQAKASAKPAGGSVPSVAG